MEGSASNGLPANVHLLPLTPAQRGMWFAETLSAEASANIAQYVVISHQPGDFDVDLFVDCCEEVGKIVESPFVRLTEVDGIPMQYVDVDYNQHVDVFDFTNDPDPEAAALAWMQAEYRRPVDLLNDQLIVIALLRVSDSRVFWYNRCHHIILDGYAALSVMRRTVDRYNAIRAGVEPGGREPLTMAELVENEAAYQASTRRETDRQHWATRVSDLPERVTLSQSLSTAPVVLDNIVASTTLDSALQARIIAAAQSCESSMAVLLSAAFGAFLARMTSADDIVLSLPVTGRATAAVKRSGGMVSNILPIRLRDVLGGSARDLVAATQLELTGALRHQRYRSDDIKRDAGLDGSTYGFGPRINMVFFEEPVVIDGADVEYRILTSGVLEDLLVNLYQSSPDAPLVVDVHGNPHLYSTAEIETHHRRFLRFVEEFIENLDTPVVDLELLLTGEAERLAEAESGSLTALRSSSNLLDGYLAQALAHPERIAVVDDAREWTYAQFDGLRRFIAEALLDRGVGPGDRVAVELDRSVSQVAAVYAALTCGAAYVPLDPAAPAARRELVLATAGPRVVVDSEFLESIGFGPDVSGASSPATPLEPGHIAYVIFTSGSTGTPKGVEVSTASIANRLGWVQELHPIGSSDAMLYKTPFTFDVSAGELFWPLQVGARLVVAQAGGHRDPDYLRRVIRDRAVTTVHFVPSMLEVFVDSARPGAPLIPPGVRRIFTSGESLPARLAQRVIDESAARVVNLYGPTEAAVEVTEYVVVGGESVIPIGRPVPNTSTYILDPRLQRVPAGVAGELYLAGVQLAHGYVGQMALTAERFVADPYVDGAQMYRTGDLVRWNVDGNIEYLGRTDFQVKIRGQRVELGEIEAALLAQGSVDQTVVVVRTDHGSPAIVGYVRPADPAADTASLIDQLQAWCVRHLPRYMVPAAFVIITEFPINASGKLDRAALPAPTYETVAVHEYVPPVTESEKQLVRVLGELLEAERIGLRDNIFALGADSLVAARLASRLRNECRVDVALSDVFESVDIAELAARMGASPTAEGRYPLEPMLRPDHLPLAYAQTRLWFINRLDPTSAAYNMPGAVDLGDQVDLNALRAAVLDVVDRHEILRTRFPAHEGEPVQDIAAVDQIIDQFGLPVIEVGAEGLSAAVFDEVSSGFDLASQLPFRTRLLRADSSYVLVVVLHHIAGDGASLRPLITDLLTAYAARSAGHAPQWLELPVQFGDFTLWQRAMLGDRDDPSSRLNAELDYWKYELDGLADTLALPADRVRPRIASGRGSYVDARIPEATAEGVRDLAVRLGVTPFTIVHAALATVLGRLADVSDVAIGTAVAGRDEPETADMVGMFVNTVVLRTAVSPAATAIDAIMAAHSVRTRALQHSQVPFEQVVDAIAPQRSRSHSPIFQVTLTMQRDNRSAAHIEDAGGVLIDARPGVAKVDLEVAVVDHPETAEGMDVELCYALDLFDEPRIAAFAEQLTAMLNGIVVHPDLPLGRIDLADEASLQDAAMALARPTTPGTLRDMIALGEAKAAALAPGIVGNGTLTHRLVASQTNQLARELLSRGIGAGDVVAVSIPRSHHSVVAMIAVAKTGAAFVMIDPRHPADRRAELVSESNAVVGITACAVGDLPAGIDWIVIDSEADELQLAGHSGRSIRDDELVRPVRPDNAAYVLFTSGSTGKPKGAVVSNRAIANVAVGSLETWPMDEHDCMLHVGAPSFDGAMGELATAWLAGAKIAVADFDTYAGVDLENFIAQHRVTHGCLTPAAVSTLDPVKVPSFRTVVCGGEVLPPEMVHRWAALGDRRMFNIYGPTEAAVWVTIDGPFGVDDEITIGQLGHGVGALVLDSALRPVPDGVSGELYILGEQVGIGYLARPDVTATSFVASPFHSGERMYRTGDRVMRRPDGRFVYHGRVDFQLKIRGQRIEPGELDSVLLDHSDVTNAVSIGASGPAGDTVLVSYVSLVSGSTVSPAEIIDYAAEHLPPFLVPRAVRVVEEFEWTPIGKIDRKKLPPIEFAVSSIYEAPRTQLESVVADIFGQVLGLERVSAHDDFFDLGGNSLSATKVVARLGTVLDVQVPVATLFDASTVAALAERASAAMGGRPMVPLAPRKRAELVPVSGVQRGMWLMNRADPASPVNNIALALRLAGELDVLALKAAVADIVGRHEALRTSYPMINGEPSQLIGTLDTTLRGANLDPVDLDGPLDRAIAELTGVGFDVTAAPPVRFGLLRVSPMEHVVVVVIYHISADGSSMAPLARDLMVAYAARAAQTEPAWAPLRVQYADFALWQAERLSDLVDEGVTERQRQLAYWKARLAGAPEVLTLPTDRPRPHAPSFVGEVVDFQIPADLVTQVDELAHSNNATPFMVLQAAYAVLLARLAGTNDVVVGTPFAGRSDAALDDVVGMFVNTLALRTTINPAEPFVSLLTRVRADDLADMANTDVAFDEVVADLALPPSTAFNPVFQSMFWYQNIEFPTVELNGLTISPVPEELTAAKVDLQLTLYPNDPADPGHIGAGQSMRGELLFARDLFERSTVEKHAERYVHILSQIVADPAQAVGDISLSSAAELAAVDAVDTAPVVPLPELLRAAAADEPGGVAITEGSSEVTFGALSAMTTAMSAALPDPDSALVTSLMSLVPDLATKGPEALGAALDVIRGNAMRATATNVNPTSLTEQDSGV